MNDETLINNTDRANSFEEDGYGNQQVIIEEIQGTELS